MILIGVVAVGFVAGIEFTYWAGIVPRRSKAAPPREQGLENPATPGNDEDHALAAATGQEPAPASDKIKQEKTLGAMREIGRAMLAWLTDRRTTGDDGFTPPSSEVRASFTIHRTGRPERFPYALLSHAELEQVLVPTFLPMLPKRDAWGHPLQFAVNSDLLAHNLVAIRSPGKDGEFDTDDYEIKGFLFDEYGQDIVWADGYGVRWPMVKP